MLRSAQSLLSPHEVALVLAGRPRPEEVVRPPAERAWLVAVWVGVVGFCLAFWAAVALILAR
ncbi:hypothetical protein [Actinoplanes subtropicus]|uniref:hypothetical protein n=1 Tax=Actinoplanes subtropicus TaxID=543632 RepID=UPI000B019235|nr:hypothetical protein [Actinoplanes subtropicus]